MSDRLTDKDLDLLEGLHGEATPGPWDADRRGGVTAIFEGMAEVISESADQVHADLIAAVHNALPALLAEVREHRAMRARLLGEHFPVEVEPSDTICGGCSTLRGSGDSLRYFPSVEWPCPVAGLVDGDDR